MLVMSLRRCLRVPRLRPPKESSRMNQINHLTHLLGHQILHRAHLPRLHATALILILAKISTKDLIRLRDRRAERDLMPITGVVEGRDVVVEEPALDFLEVG